MMRMIDLFSGIGGFHYAAEQVWEDVECLVHCEIDPFCQKVLKKHWPEVAIEPDIHRLDGSKYADVDLLTGGFPCQPYSVAGQRRGAEDDRALWPQMLRVIKSARPRWIVCENVTGILSISEPISTSNVESRQAQRLLESDYYNSILSRQEILQIGIIIDDIQKAGYELPELIDGTPIIWVIPACAVDAPHRRDRVWIVAHAKQSNGGNYSARTGRRGSPTKQKTLSQINREAHTGNIGQVRKSMADARSAGICERRITDDVKKEYEQSRRMVSNGAQKRPICKGETLAYAANARAESMRGRQDAANEVAADRNRAGRQEQRQPEPTETQHKALERRDRRSAKRRLGGMANGISCWLDEPADIPRVTTGQPNRGVRLKALGNAIVPQVAIQIMKSIRSADEY